MPILRNRWSDERRTERAERRGRCDRYRRKISHHHTGRRSQCAAHQLRGIHENEELAITGQGDMKDLTIKMTAAFVEMEGVVVTGMAPRKSESFTGSYVRKRRRTEKNWVRTTCCRHCSSLTLVSALWKTTRKDRTRTPCPNSRCGGNVQLDNNFSNSDMNMLVGNYPTSQTCPFVRTGRFWDYLTENRRSGPERSFHHHSEGRIGNRHLTVRGKQRSSGVWDQETAVRSPERYSYSMSMGITMPDPVELRHDERSWKAAVRNTMQDCSQWCER